MASRRVLRVDWNVRRPSCKSVCCLLAEEGIILPPVVQHSNVEVGRDKQAIMDSEHEHTVALCREGREGNIVYPAPLSLLPPSLPLSPSLLPSLLSPSFPPSLPPSLPLLPSLPSLPPPSLPPSLLPFLNPHIMTVDNLGGMSIPPPPPPQPQLWTSSPGTIPYTSMLNRSPIWNSACPKAAGVLRMCNIHSNWHCESKLDITFILPLAYNNCQ